MGQVAYEACRQYLVSDSQTYEHPDELHAEWEQLPIAYREGWEAGAQALLAERDANQSMPGERAVGDGSIYPNRTIE
jgi:hypothetical protein